MSRQPNVILVLTDDQGYGDLGCTGNPRIRTPHLDRFAGESVRFTDFHVHPLCTPTRGAIMTGRRPLRNGAWATMWGRSLLRRDEVTLAEVFAGSGYRTGLFGKWHLGDNYPYRPQDRGFHTVVAHKGGGVGQTPDFWGNDYFDDTYFRNGQPTRFEGYCTDVWFREAERFILANREAPFFAMVATNAPHWPYRVDRRYSDPHRGLPEVLSPEFYGMIESIDENFGHLRDMLRAQRLEDRTILLFLTDNGSSGGAATDANEFAVQGYNAGLRGIKGSHYEGGHRAPCFLRWPEGGLAGGREIGEMALDVDLMPTLADLCGLSLPSGPRLDGTSLASLLRGETDRLPGDRVHFIQIRQDTRPPEPGHYVALAGRYRLVRGAELYDVAADPGQRRDCAAEHPEVVLSLRQAHEAFWQEVAPSLDAYCPIVLGHPAENPARLDACDVMGDGAWDQSLIVEAQKTTGRWAVEVASPGMYRFALRRWPEELDVPIDAPIGEEDFSFGDPVWNQEVHCRVIRPVRASLSLFGRTVFAGVEADSREVVFHLPVDQAGPTTLEAWFHDAGDKRQGAYYVYVLREGDDTGALHPGEKGATG